MDPHDDTHLLARAVTVPAHVVFREFPQETVALNLDTGQFHGLNPTASHIVTSVTRVGTAHEALDGLAEDYGIAVDQIARSVAALLRQLSTRELIVLGEAAAE